MRIDITAQQRSTTKEKTRNEKNENREHTIEFTKDKLDKTIKTVKAGTWVFAKGIEGLCLYVGKFKHTYYAHWGIKIVKPDGKRTTTGKEKKLGS